MVLNLLFSRWVPFFRLSRYLTHVQRTRPHPLPTPN